MLRSWLAVGLACCAAAAQSFFVPSNSTSGTCENVPFGELTVNAASNHRYQTRLSAAQLGGVPNTITGLGFVSVAGTTNSVPVQLSASPACYLFTDPMFTAVVPVTGSMPPTSAGSASYAVQIPPGVIGFRFCAEFAMWPASPAIVVATSNYLHVLTGN